MPPKMTLGQSLLIVGKNGEMFVCLPMTEYEGCSVVPPQLHRETGKPPAVTKAEKLESLIAASGSNCRLRDMNHAGCLDATNRC